jgi:hypothetical protein
VHGDPRRRQGLRAAACPPCFCVWRWAVGGLISKKVIYLCLFEHHLEMYDPIDKALSDVTMSCDIVWEFLCSFLCSFTFFSVNELRHCLGIPHGICHVS